MSPIKWVSAEPARGEYLTIDSQQRIYMSAAACELIGVEKDGNFSLFVGHDLVNRRIVVAKPEIVRLNNVRPFTFDSRRYAYAKSYVKDAAIAQEELPMKFEYVGRDFADTPKGAFSFQLQGTSAPDDTGRG